MRILDLFAGTGLGAKGMLRAMPDAELIGVDLEPCPNYPGAQFIQRDAYLYLYLFGEEFDLIFATPNQEHYSGIHHNLQEIGVDYIIEHQAPYYQDKAITLCGTMFGQRIPHHRSFVANFPIAAPYHNSIQYHRSWILDTFISEDAEAVTKWYGESLDIPGVMMAMPPDYSEYMIKQWITHRGINK